MRFLYIEKTLQGQFKKIRLTGFQLTDTDKAKEPSSSFKRLASELDLSASLQDVFLIPYSVASETFVWSFQYRILHQILMIYKRKIIQNRSKRVRKVLLL